MTTPHTCPRCAERSIDGLLCHECTSRTRTALRAVAELWPTLWETITRQTRMGTDVGRVTGSSEKPLAFHPTAADVKDTVRAGLVGWVRVTVEDIPAASWPQDRAGAMVAHLLRWLPDMRRHEAAAELAAEAISWPGKIRRAVDYPEERSRIPVGLCCLEVGEDGTPCPGVVTAVVFEDPLIAPVMRCGECAQEWPTWEWRRAGARMRERLESAG